MDTDIDVVQVTGQIAASLASRYEGILSAATVERFVSDSFAKLAGQARVMDFLALLTERMVHERLRVTLRFPEPDEPEPEAGPARSLDTAAADQVLLVCGSDPTLGLVAAAVLHRLSRGRVTVRLAAPDAGGPVSGPPMVASAALGAGLDLYRHRLAPLTRAAIDAATVLVTVSPGDSCPIVAGKRYLDWGLAPSPAHDAQKAAALMEQVSTRATALLASLPHPIPYLRVIPL